MTESMLFYVAIYVFAMMVIGLGLTIFEFHRGEPARQAARADVKKNVSTRANTPLHANRTY